MTQAQGIDAGGNPPGADEAAAVRLFLASARNVPVRLFAAAALAVAALPVTGGRIPLLWMAGLCGVSLVEDRLANAVQRGLRLPIWRGVALPTVGLSMTTGALYTVLIAVLWTSADPVGRALAMACCCMAILYSLLQYYARPLIFLLAASPYLAAVALAVGDMCARAVSGGRPWIVLTAVGGLGQLCFLFVIARRQLSASRQALHRARAEAQERGVAAEAANEAKSAFLATMSHEIRTPLNGVLGMAQAMAADDLSDPQRERLEVIRQSGESLLAILNDVLDLSKIEAGRFELEQVAFDLAELMRGAHSAFTALANKKGLSFDLVVEPDAKGVYVGDPTRMRQILYNLISNALKFTEIGEVRVRAAHADNMLTLAVSDTGIGIPIERQSALFEKFTQADVSTTRRFGGTGLGLAICRQLAGLMGGAISVESGAGEGATFRVCLPLAKIAGAPERNAVCLQASSSEPTLPKLRVLAAEDNSVNQLVLKTLLHQIGVEPRVVENGEQAVTAWREGAWDVILMDMQMPVMDGLTAARAIREAEASEGRGRTPILALTANAMSHQIQQCVAAGVDGHVAKPIEAARLFEALEAALRHESPLAEAAV
jgi:signal transduction histidine kinase/ActR/RegA family two-component response regulator